MSVVKGSVNPGRENVNPLRLFDKDYFLSTFVDRFPRILPFFLSSANSTVSVCSSWSCCSSINSARSEVSENAKLLQAVWERKLAVFYSV